MSASGFGTSFTTDCRRVPCSPRHGERVNDLPPHQASHDEPCRHTEAAHQVVLPFDLQGSIKGAEWTQRDAIAASTEHDPAHTWRNGMRLPRAQNTILLQPTLGPSNVDCPGRVFFVARARRLVSSLSRSEGFVPDPFARLAFTLRHGRLGAAASRCVLAECMLLASRRCASAAPVLQC